MKFINSANTTATKPAYTGTGTTPAYAQDSGGTPTTWNPESYNMLMSEVINAVTGQGVSLSATDDTQLSQVLTSISNKAESKTGIHFVTPRKFADSGTISTGYQLFNLPEVPSNAKAMIISSEIETYESRTYLESLNGVEDFIISSSMGGHKEQAGNTSQSFVPTIGNNISLKKRITYGNNPVTLNVYIQGYII